LHQNLKLFVLLSHLTTEKHGLQASRSKKPIPAQQGGDKAVEKTPLLLYIYCNDWGLAVSY
jgi:hypothetical protein